MRAAAWRYVLRVVKHVAIVAVLCQQQIHQRAARSALARVVGHAEGELRIQRVASLASPELSRGVEAQHVGEKCAHALLHPGARKHPVDLLGEALAAVCSSPFSAAVNSSSSGVVFQRKKLKREALAYPRPACSRALVRGIGLS